MLRRRFLANMIGGKSKKLSRLYLCFCCSYAKVRGAAMGQNGASTPSATSSLPNGANRSACCYQAARLHESDASLGGETCVFVFNAELAMLCSSSAFVRQAGLDQKSFFLRLPACSSFQSSSHRASSFKPRGPSTGT